MQYLADILTFSRFIIATVLICLALFDHQVDVGVGFALFMIAELTDAFDGTLATKFPFPKDQTPKYRRYASRYDMIADTYTAIAAAVFFTLRVNLVAGIIIMVSYCGLALAIEGVVYGKLFGHPDNCTKDSLLKRDFARAKKLIMARRALYLTLIAVVAAWMLYASKWADIAKIIITIIAIISSIFLWFFLKQRRHHISRDAVEIENSLATKSHQSKNNDLTQKSHKPKL